MESKFEGELLIVSYPIEKASLPLEELEMVELPAGSFRMGCGDSDKYCADDEKPAHEVRLDGFWMGKYEVTQGQWEAVMGYNPSGFKKGIRYPVENVSWNHAREFIRRLNEIVRRSGLGYSYRLPTEAQWEHACRSETKTVFSFGDCLSTEQANYDGDYPVEGCPKGKYRGSTTEVGSFPSNAWGFHDMHGNVWEWCEDDWHGSYEGAPTDGSAWVGDPRGSDRVLRGGAYNYNAWYCRSTNRGWSRSDNRSDNLGFRLVRLPGQR